MVSFFAEVKFFRFWPKTMDYNKNKNISEKMSEYVGFSSPPTYFLHTLLGLAGLVGLQ